MADSGDRLIGLGKVLHSSDHLMVEADVLWGTTTRNDQSIVVGGVNVGKGGIQGKVVTRLFRIGLVALEVVDSGTDEESVVPYTVDRLKSEFSSFKDAKDFFGIPAKSWESLAHKLNRSKI